MKKAIAPMNKMTAPVGAAGYTARKRSLPLGSSHAWFSAVLLVGCLLASPALNSQVLDNYDPNFDEHEGVADSYVAVISVVPGQMILAGGSFFEVGTASAPSRMARLFAQDFATWTPALAKSGAWDNDFFAYPNGTGVVGAGRDYVWQISAHENHGVIASGTFTSIGGAGKDHCARLELNNGSAEPFLPPIMIRGGNLAHLPALATQLRGGDVLIWGDFATGQSVPPGSYTVDRVGLMRWNMFSGHYDLGLLDGNFNADLLPTAPATAGVLYSLAVQDDGQILIAGVYDHVNAVATNRIIRLNAADASTDPTFNAPASINAGFVLGMVLQTDGKILVNYLGSIRRLNSNGSVDLTFSSPVVDGPIYSMILRQDGKILFGGLFTNVNGTPRSNVAMVDSLGNLDASFAPTTNAEVYCIAIQDTGKVLLGGLFTQVNGQTRRRLARFNADVPATNSIAVATEGTDITWTRSGSSPELHNVDFEVSTDNKNFTSLGSVQATATGWEKTGMSGSTLPGNKVFYLRLSGNSSCGLYNMSEGLIETKQSYYRPAPRIASQPTALTKNEGDSATFAVVASAVLPTIAAPTIVLPYGAATYQWFKGSVPLVDGPNISGAQTSTLTINAVAPGDAASYKAVITNNAGSITSTAALLKVIVKPIISVDPLSQNIGLNKPVSFSVKLSQGTLPLVYQWMFNGSPTMPAGVTGATTAKLTIAHAQLLHEGTFKVVVSNSAGSDTSADAMLNVIDVLPAIVPVANQLVAVGTANVTFAPGVTSEVTPVFAWLKNGKVIAGATTDTLVIASAQVIDAASYQLKATNPLGLTTSTAMELGVVDTANRRVMAKLNASTVIAPPIGGKGLTFRWFKVGVVSPLADGLDYSGTATAKLTVKTTTVVDEGQYFCEVTMAGVGAPLNTGMYDLYVAVKPEFTAATAIPGGKVSDATYSFPFTDFNPDPHFTPTSFTASGLPPA